MCSRSPGHGHSYRCTGSLAARGGREIPARRRTFQTVECAKPVAPATSLGPQPVLRRHPQIASSSSGASREARARGAATALQQAIQPTLSAGCSLEVDHVMIQQVGVSESVIVRAVFSERGQATPLIGSAIIHDDVATASVHALLQAVNRKLH